MVDFGRDQRAVLVALRDGLSLRTVEAGRLVHRARYGDDHLAGTKLRCCDFCVYDGRRVLRGLADFGLVKRDRDGAWADATDGHLGGLLTGSNGR